MPLFKDTVALEACPAKTAESIGYGATFVVLAWLLVNNYSGIGYAEQESQPLANMPILDPATPLISAQAAAAQEDVTALITTSLTQADPSTQTSQFNTSPPAWHSNLSPYQQLDSQAQRRTFSVAERNHRESQVDQPIEGHLEPLALPLAVIDIDYAFDIQNLVEPDHSRELANTDMTEGQLIREITVSGTETARLTARPSNIQRPQIPRPYRAEALQRSILLPPRTTQALRP
tara:strand:+ start:10047 stop:10745 length:699 start_codon:yes stop_codon:yes gene_type:complete